MGDSGNNGSKTILVVEDDFDMRDLICSLLNDAEFKTVPASDGLEGLEKAQEIKPDLIILDVMLPHKNGLEVCRILSTDTETKHIPVIMVTVKRDLSLKLASFIAGARRYLTKPFSDEDFISEVNTVLRQPCEDISAGPVLFDAF